MKWNKIAQKILMASFVTILSAGTLAGCGNSDNASSSETNVSTQDNDSGSENSGKEESGNENEDSGELKELKIGFTGQDDAFVGGLMNVAYKEGYLAEELEEIGYTPKPVAALTGPVLNESLASGDLDATVYGDFPAFTAAANGLGNKIVAVVDSKYQYGILAADSAGISSTEDINGKTVCVTQGTVIQFFWDRYVAANGLDASSINIVNSTDMSTLFQSGDIDLGVSTLASTYYFETLGIGASVFDTGEDSAYTTFVATVRGDLLDEEPEIGVALNKALIRSYNAVLEDADILYKDQETGNITADKWEQAQSFDPTFDNLKVEITDETLDFYEDLNQWMVDNGVISSAVDLDDFVRTEYYEQAVEELGE
jgi:ABC-type nitrate/sulfonate/bicarbonate transport system substrate-binding protein